MKDFIGHLHPLLVHVPIGILLLAFVVSLLPREKWERMSETVRLALLITAVAAISSCIAGYLLSQNGEYDESLVAIHQQLGIATAVLSSLAYLINTYRRQLIWINTLVMIITSHYGGSLTHGQGFLFGNKANAQQEEKFPVVDSIRSDTSSGDKEFVSIEKIKINDAVFTQDIEPILKQKCYGCHSAVKMKGGLRLDSKTFILKGGKKGKIFKPNDPNHSKLYTQLLLPLDDDHHMPPKGKKQLTKSEINKIYRWIDAGALFSVTDKHNTQKDSTIKNQTTSAVSKNRIRSVKRNSVFGDDPLKKEKSDGNHSDTKINIAEKFSKDVWQEYQLLTDKLDYNIDVKPILSDKCFACHGPDKAKQKAGLRLDKAAVAFAPLPETPGKVAIKKGDYLNSEVFHRMLSSDPEYIMPIPASHLTLSAKEKAIVIKWIEQGAEYKPHWAFVKPIKTEPPKIEGVQHPVDRFVMARLKKMKLQPSPKASKELLLRRASLDITGLPPSPKEIDAFLEDHSANAFEKQVERLLQSPHYGERMAADWLDLARFADSHGYTVDRLRDMSPYRDWVIRAFNSNMRYDRFIHEQLAGDLMPNPNKNMIIATAFNRNHQQNLEGGIVEEEFQTEYVIDRTNTFGEAFMAMSIGCARCHDHKFDPISQKNYYQLFSFFNNVLEAGQIAWNDDIPTPALPLPTDAQEKELSSIKEKIMEDEQNVVTAYLLSKKESEKWIQKKMYSELKKEKVPVYGLQSHHTLNTTLADQLDSCKIGEMKHDWGEKGDLPVYTKGKDQQGLQLNGDVYLDLQHTGVFRSSDPFTIGMWVWVPKNLREGVIFHKADAERLYNYKGFSVSLKNKGIEVMMAHTAPSNAIIKQTISDIPREKWIQVSLAYDGSSKAAGLDLYIDGDKVEMTVIKDKLYKDIIFFSKTEPALQIGGWYRGSGFTGGKVDEVLVYNRRLSAFELRVIAEKNHWKDIAAKKYDQLNSQDKEVLQDFYAQVFDTTFRSAMEKLRMSRRELADSMEKVKELMVMEEMLTPKKSYLLQRGQYNMRGEEVFPNTPEEIFQFSSYLPKNRYGLAQWLTDKDHPLTARVAVNRLWQQFFGVGLVKTSEDFGNQGELPSHPELLDWLAVEFQESGWDIQHMIKLIVLSDTYQQSSAASVALREIDPENRLLARGPSARLTAEMMRDNALFACGLLNKKVGGPSVKPYQPAGLWEINSANYIQDSTNEIYRRSVYVVIKRTVPHPTLATFDASERSSCLARRQKTNTPLQALVLLNDPTYLEASKVLGEQMTKFSDEAEGIRYAYRSLTGLIPTDKELQLLLLFQKREMEKFDARPEKTNGWLKTGMYKTDSSLNKIKIAANAVVASTILNSDAVITKR